MGGGFSHQTVAGDGQDGDKLFGDESGYIPISVKCLATVSRHP